jgi:hypothetical protein
MKKFLCILVVASWSVITANAAAPPAVTVHKAVKLADDYLKGRGFQNSTYIASVSLESAVMFGPPQHWVVKWGKPIPEAGTKKKESGVKVTLDGTLFRIVE